VWVRIPPPAPSIHELLPSPLTLVITNRVAYVAGDIGAAGNVERPDQKRTPRPYSANRVCQLVWEPHGDVRNPANDATSWHCSRHCQQSAYLIQRTSVVCDEPGRLQL
jgi:hypothetical protein